MKLCRRRSVGICNCTVRAKGVARIVWDWGTRLRCRKRIGVRGAEGGETETLKASRDTNGEGVYLAPQPTRDLREHRKFPAWTGAEPQPKTILVFSKRPLRF